MHHGQTVYVCLNRLMHLLAYKGNKNVNSWRMTMLTEQQLKERREKSERIAAHHHRLCAGSMMADALGKMQKQMANRCGITSCTSFATGQNCLKCSQGRKQLGKGI